MDFKLREKLVKYLAHDVEDFEDDILEKVFQSPVSYIGKTYMNVEAGVKRTTMTYTTTVSRLCENGL